MKMKISYKAGDLFACYIVRWLDYCNCCISVVQVSLVFSDSGSHQLLPIFHSVAITEPVFRDDAVPFVLSSLFVF